MPLLEKPLIGYTIEAAKTERILDRIVVSTEDPEIAKISKTFGVQVIDRPKDMSKDESNIDEALKHAVNMIEKEGKGVFLYLRQEGRGIGLKEKIKHINYKKMG